MATRSKDRRWKTKFGKFVAGYGVARLAKRLGVQSPAIYHWVRGVKTPRPDKARAIQCLAARRGVRLSVDEIYEHFREVRRVRVPQSRLHPRVGEI